MSLFDEKKNLSREEIKNTLRRDSGIIPKTGGKKYYEKDRGRMTEIFGSKYGSEISRDDFKHAMGELKESHRKATDPVEKRELGNKLEYMKRIGGKDAGV